MGSSRAAAVLIVALDAAVVVRVASVWQRLPPLMASHFGPTGVPNGWMPRDQFFWFMATVGGGITALFAFSPFLLRLIPARFVNLPNRDYWLAPERQQTTIAALSGWMAWFGVGLTAFLAVIMELVLRANLARAPLAHRPMMMALGGYFLIVLLSLAGLYRKFRLPSR